MQGEDLKFKWKNLKKIQELQRQLTPTQSNEATAMEIDTMLEGEGKGEEEIDEEDVSEAQEVLFFMELDHKEIREIQDQDAQKYWEAGITKECLNALKTGGVDHSQKQCYHCSCKEHIKANCPKRRKLGTQPWKRRKGEELRTYTRKRKMFGRDNSAGREGNRKKITKRNSQPIKGQ